MILHIDMMRTMPVEERDRLPPSTSTYLASVDVAIFCNWA